MGTPITTPGSNRDNCPKISTSCVIWQGPNIPCIDLCAGDSIDEVVFKLATLLCDVTENVLDVSTLDFACLVASGAAEPTTLLQTLQLIITKVCYIDANGSTGGGTGGRPLDPSSSDPIIDLPTCLYFDEDGDTVTSLPLSEYAAYLASVICTIITDVASNTSSINSLTTRVISLEQAVANLTEYTYEIYVVSQCASSSTPGQSLLIEEAFVNLETSFCNLLGTTGFSTALIAAINKQCSNLSNNTQLVDPSYLMNELPGWIATPTTVADTITNMWLTMCDMRTKFANYLGTTTPQPCILATPENVTITTIGTTTSTVEWSAPSYSGIEAPTGYRIEIFEWTGTAPTGPSVYDATVPTTFLTHSFSVSALVIDQDYVVYVHAIYSCGESNGARVISELIVPTILYKVTVADVEDVPSSIYCVEGILPVELETTNNITTVTLTNAVTGAPVTNDDSQPINVKIRYIITSCSFYGPVYDDVIIPILNGNTSAQHAYSAVTYNNCGTATCTEVTKTLSCGVSTGQINSEFDTATITVC